MLQSHQLLASDCLASSSSKRDKVSFAREAKSTWHKVFLNNPWGAVNITGQCNKISIFIFDWTADGWANWRYLKGLEKMGFSEDSTITDLPGCGVRVRAKQDKKGTP